MPDHLENLHFSHGGFFYDLIVLCFLELFDGKDLLVIVALALEHYAIGALSYYPQNIVFLH